jgi:RNA polymerase sigma-70 factor (ECF subfamily)
MDQALTVDVVPHIPMLRRYALKLARNPPDADDLVQDCLLRALARGHQFEPGTNLAAWLVTILRNLFLTRYQRAKRIVEVELEPEIAEVSMEAPQFHSVELRDAEMAIRDLKPEQRQVIHKCGVEGVSYEDAASEMGVSVGTIRSRLSRARSQLRERVAGRIRPAYLNSRVERDQVNDTEHQIPDHPCPEDIDERDPETSEPHVSEPARTAADNSDNGGSMIAPADLPEAREPQAEIDKPPSVGSPPDITPPKTGSAAFPVPPSFRPSFSGTLHTAPGTSRHEHGAAQTRGFYLSVERIGSRGGGPPVRWKLSRRRSAFDPASLRLPNPCREFPDIAIRVSRGYPIRPDRNTGRCVKSRPNNDPRHRGWRSAIGHKSGRNGRPSQKEGTNPCVNL